MAAIRSRLEAQPANAKERVIRQSPVHIFPTTASPSGKPLKWGQANQVQTPYLPNSVCVLVTIGLGCLPASRTNAWMVHTPSWRRLNGADMVCRPDALGFDARIVQQSTSCIRHAQRVLDRASENLPEPFSSEEPVRLPPRHMTQEVLRSTPGAPEHKRIKVPGVEPRNQKPSHRCLASGNHPTLHMPAITSALRA